MYQIFINNEEVKTENTFSINEEFLNTSNIILNKVYPKSWSINKLLTEVYFPSDYSKCKILKNGNLIFTGYVKNSGDFILDFNKPKYATLQVLDYKGLLSEGKTLDFVITGKTVAEAIEQVVEAISDYGFVLGNINILNDEVIGAYSTLDKTPFDIFQYFSEITGCLWTTRIVDEEHTAIDFCDPELLPKAPNIEYSLEYLKNNKIESILPSFSTTDYRNKQIILSESVFSSIDTQEIKYTNGYDSIFVTELPIGKISSITINGEEMTIATTTEKELGIYADFYYKSGELQFQSEEVLSSGQKIIISYTSMINGRETFNNNTQIDRIKNQLSRNGTIERYETRNDITNSKELLKVASNYIKFNSKPEITLSITTRNNDLFKIGQRTHFNIDNDKLNDDYMVKSKTIKVIQSGEIIETIYTYSLINTFNAESEINFFDNQRRKASGNISDGEFITRNIDINNVININFKNLVIEEVV